MLIINTIYNNTNVFIPLVVRFRLQVRVQDETGTVSVSLFNEEVQALVDNMTAYQLVEKYGKVNSLKSRVVMHFRFLMSHEDIWN